MKRYYGLLAALMLLLLDATAYAKGDQATAKLQALKGSGVTGTVWLTDNGNGTTTVKVQLSDKAGDHPAHIHKGTLDKYDRSPQFPLENVMNGMSETTVKASVADLADGNHIVAVHESVENISNVQAAGEIKMITGTPDTGGGGTARTNSVALPLMGGLVLTMLALAHRLARRAGA